jgi:ribosome-associated translation inhibitor RaiA
MTPAPSARRADEVDVEVHSADDLPRGEREAARERIASLAEYTDEPLLGGRITLRRLGHPTTKRPWVADASVLLNGRLLAAHVTGPTAVKAADEAADRLRRQLRRAVGAEVAQRNEPAAIRAALEGLGVTTTQRPEARRKPPETRRIVHRKVFGDELEPTLSAVADLLDLDHEFHLFRHVRTGEDVVVYRRDDGRIGLIHPPGSPLADENDVVVTEPSRYSSPMTLDDARAEMDMLNHRFLYFIDANDGRGKVIFLRHDGDYGLVEPA